MKTSKCALHLIALVFFCSLFSPAARAEEISLGQFREMLEQVLETNPEIVRTALFRAEAVESARQATETKRAATDLIRLAQSPTSPMPAMGAPSGSYVVVEVIDYRCPYCRLMHAQTTQLLRVRPDVRVAFVITSILGKESETLARFALAADEQGKFGVVHNALFSPAKPIDSGEAAVRALAARTGVDWIRAKAAMNSESITRRINAMKQSWEALNQPGTPLTIVGSDVFPGVTEASEIVRTMATTQSSGAASR